jgi:hypothetical protein
MAKRPITEVDPGERHAMSDRAALYRSKLDYALVEILRRRNMATTADDAERVMVTPLVQTCLLGLVAREVSSASTREHGCTARESLIPHTDSSSTYDMVDRRFGGRSGAGTTGRTTSGHPAPRSTSGRCSRCPATMCWSPTTIPMTFSARSAPNCRLP